MKFQDLKKGMIVQLRNGGVRMFKGDDFLYDLDGRITYTTDWYLDDMSDEGDNSMHTDIVKVFDSEMNMLWEEESFRSRCPYSNEIGDIEILHLCDFMCKKHRFLGRDICSEKLCHRLNRYSLSNSRISKCNVCQAENVEGVDCFTAGLKNYSVCNKCWGMKDIIK